MLYTEEIDNERWEMFLETDKNVGNWRNMPEYNHKSQWWVSDHGRIKVTNNFNDLVHWPRTYFTGGHEKKRYACLSINYAPSKYIHRLVAMYFVPNPEDMPIVNHIDNNPLNNHYSNLEWCSHRHNIQHGYDIRKTATNEVSQRLYELAKEEHDQYNPRASRDAMVVSLRLEGLSYQAIANRTGVPRGTVAAIVRRWGRKNI